MNFTDFTEDLADEFNLTKKQSRAIITYLVKRLKKKILFGHEVSFREIGTFVLNVRQPRKFLNLQSGQMNTSNKIYCLNFRVTKKMKERLKKKIVY